MAAAVGPSQYQYSPAQVKFTETSLVAITKRLIATPVTPQILDQIAKLYADQVVMKTLGDGTTKTKEEVAKRIQLWTGRWNSGDFFSGMAFFEKETDKLVGVGAIGHGDDAGEAELVCLSFKEYWSKGYATEAAHALMRDVLPQIVHRENERGKYALDGQPLRIVHATALTTNLASNAIMQGLGMTYQKTQEKFGAQRNQYTYYISPNNPWIPKLGKTLIECSMQEITKLLK